MGLSDNMRAALLMMLSMTAFTINDALMKLASDEVAFFEGIFIRGCIITVGLVLLAWVRGQLRGRIARRDWALIGWRSVAEAVGTVLFLTALFKMEIANLSAIMQALPLTVTLAAALAFREPVGWRRLTAIGIGFVGVMLIIQPGTDAFNIYSVLGILSVVAVTVRDLAARRLTPTVPSGMVALGAAVCVTAMAGAGVLVEEQVPLTFSALWKLSAAAVCLMIGYIAAVSAMRTGEIGFVAPFRYTSLVVALLLGMIIFKDDPNGLMLIGSAIVVATGLFTLYRERASARKVPLGLRIR